MRNKKFVTNKNWNNKKLDVSKNMRNQKLNLNKNKKIFGKLQKVRSIDQEVS